MTLNYDLILSVWFLKTMQPSRSIELVIIYFERLNRMIQQEQALFSKLHPQHNIFFRIKKERPADAKVGYAFRSSITGTSAG